MSMISSILLSLFVAALITENYGYGYWMISRPIFAGPLIGLIMGDLNTGLIVGASVELMFMGVLPIGGSVPPNAQIAGIIGTIYAIEAHSTSLGISLALPIGILAQFLIMLAWNVNIYLVHRGDKAIESGNTKKMELLHLNGILVFFVIFFISAFLAIHFGSSFVKSLNDALPTWVSGGLSIAAGLLPAIGMAMLLKMMDFGRYWGFFLGGFVLAVYLKLNVLAVSLMGLAIAVGIAAISKTNTTSGPSETTSEDADQHLLTRKDLWHVFWRSMFTMSTMNYERYMSLGFDFAMVPVLRRLYSDKEEYIAALKRHNEFFNCHPYTAEIVLGVSAALEEQKALGKPITDATITSTKTALMGPLSGIGDSIFKATFMTIFAAIGAGLAMNGNVLGPIIFIIPNVALNLASRYLGIFWGYKFGVKLIGKMKNSDLVQKFVQGATIVGMMVTGAMVVNFVIIKLTAKWVSAGKTIALQSLLDQIFPSLLPLLITLLFYLGLKKNKKAIYWLMFVCFVIGLGGKFLGLL
ncbi:PTS system mannose/fructose/sorbose family transporter subunit IID [Lacticaseibacillus pantheris]|uniref:PTS system mannose/fructose/sorbose family transporter subunit IID n=1 Tax=Lacticaseibacillus pantheris TaxID=171523 RepID=UPI002659DC40|nr:PTS system mannose/fructose/sorbose family transporter subunit IID [Lacticaseibacillus pantheris]WKF84164.1 PTS system mannose/fructose/sorbose family transporter subunit IID [Lacticaseibacillus pantheris]